MFNKTKTKLGAMLTAVALAATMTAVVIPVTASAASSGSCGKNVTWTLDDAGTLTISGTGAMKDYYRDDTPFGKNSNIKSVVIEEMFNA